MPDPNNAALRLATVLDRAVRIGNSVGHTTQAVIVWSQTFNLPVEMPATRRPIQVGLQLGLLYDQLELARCEMASTPRVRAQFYEKHLGAVEAALNPAWLYQQWATQNAHLTPAVLDALHHLADGLAVDEAPVAPDAIGELLDMLTRLETLARGSDVSDELKLFVAAQIDAIRIALRDYEIAGAVALRRAYQTAALAFADNAPLVHAAELTPAGRRVLKHLRTSLAGVLLASGGYVIRTGEFLEGVRGIHDALPVAARVLHLEAPKEPKRLTAGVSDPAGSDATAVHHPGAMEKK